MPDIADLRIETPRLILRPTRAEDFDGFAAFGADPLATRFFGGPGPESEVWRYVTSLAGAWALYGVSMFSVIEKASGRWIGRVGPWRPHGWPGDEVGWGLLPQFWGRGYATEAAAASMDYAVETLGWTGVIHTIDPANTASVAVARRLGSSHRGPGRLPPPYAAARIDIWGQSAAEWAENRKRLDF